MTLKKRLAAVMNGWLPEESALPVCNQTVKHNRWQPIKHYAFPLILGISFGGLLAILGPFLNLTARLGPYVWPVIIVLYAGIVSASIFVRMKQKQQQNVIKQDK
ncbi:MAG: hypothetical protein WC325_04660 [Candidatus Bathyarchaeia archaeon]|jgi:hypothetical protein